MKVTGTHVNMNIPDIDQFQYIDKEKIRKSRKKIKDSGWNNLPKLPGIYFFTNKDEIYYVGETDNIYKRIKTHHVIDHTITRIYFLIIFDVSERKLLESAYMMAMKPSKNKEINR